MSLELRDLIACPLDHASLTMQDGAYVCTACGTRYDVVDGIPVLLPPQGK